MLILAFLLWWNSQSDAGKIALGVGFGLLLILLISCCCCCFCRKRGKRGAMISSTPEAKMSTDIPFQNPVENQFRYKKQVDEIA